MIFDIIREIFTAVISFLSIEFTIDEYTFSFYGILIGLIALGIAALVLRGIAGGGD